MSFEPVFLPEGSALDGRASQTFLRHYNQCPRSGFLYQLHKRDNVKTVEMVRGSALHEILERATREAIVNGEPRIPPEVVKVIADEVLGTLPVPLEEHDYVRESAYRWASEAVVDPNAVVAVETLFVLNVAGWQVRCKIDFAQLMEGGAAMLVRDYKSGRGAPAQEEIARKRPDGTLMPKTLQVVLYALALKHGVPVRVDECPLCLDGTEPDEPDVRCHVCGGSQRIEAPEPFSVADHVQRFDLEYVFPGIENRDGEMLTRPMSLTPLELAEYMGSLEATLRRLDRSIETGDWPAVISDAACSECPSPLECPIPVELRAHRGSINSVEEAAEAAALLEWEKADHRARQTEIRNFAKVNGPIRFGGMVWDFEYSEYEQLVDKEAMLAAMEQAVMYGKEFERWRYFKTKGRTDFKARDLTADELAEEQEGV